MAKNELIKIFFQKCSQRPLVGSGRARAPEDAALKGIQILEQVSRSEVEGFANPSRWAEFSSQELG